jgi:hypothetical protein
MKRRSYIIGILAAGLTLAGMLGNPGYSKFVSSAHNFREQFRSLQDSGASLGPLERFVYSLVLANQQSTPTEKHTAPREPRT